MLNDWQIALLDQGLWLVPVMGAFALALLPWTDDQINETAESFRRLFK